MCCRHSKLRGAFKLTGNLNAVRSKIRQKIPVNLISAWRDGEIFLMRESRPSASGRARPFNPAPLAPLPPTGAADPSVSQDAAHAQRGGSLPAVPQHPGGRWRSSALQRLALGPPHGDDVRSRSHTLSHAPSPLHGRSRRSPFVAVPQLTPVSCSRAHCSPQGW